MTRKTWQSDHPRVRKQHIEELCFPGTHHAAMYDEDAADWWYTQTRDVYTQLNDGIRFLDIRVQSRGDGEGTLFYGHHGGAKHSGADGDWLAETGAPLDTVFAHVRKFLDEVADQGATEMLVVKFSNFWDSRGAFGNDEFEAAHWTEFEELLQHHLGDYLLDRRNRGEWSDLIATTSLSDFDGPRVAVVYEQGETADFAWDKAELDEDDEWRGSWLQKVRPGAIYLEAMAEDLAALGWMVTGDFGKISLEILEDAEDVANPLEWFEDADEDRYDHLREAASKLNPLLGGIVAEIKADPDKRPSFIMLDYYETSNVVEYARELSVLGVGNSSPGDVPPVNEAVYTIRSQDSGDVVEVEDGWGADPDEDGAPVAEEEYRGDADQRWKLRRNDDGTYRIENDYSGKVLDVEGYGTTDGDDVHQWGWHGGDNQRWYAIPLRDGNYCFLNEESGKVLDGANPGDNVHQWEWHGKDNQRWKLEKREEVRSDPILQPSLYRIRRSGFYGDYAVAVADSSASNGADVRVESEADAPGQLFSFEPLDDGTYEIVNVHSGKVVDGYWPDDGTEIHQYEWHGGDNQRWYLQDVGDGEYALVNKASRLVLDAHGLVDGENVRQDEWDNRRNHRWEVEQPESARIEETVYQLESVDSGLVADVKYKSADDGTNVWMWDKNYTEAQKFRFDRLDDGTYKVANVFSGKVVDGYWPRDGNDVHQYGWHGGDNQRWYVYDVGDGAYALVNKASGRVMDASGPNKKANVHQWEWHGGDNQRWLLDQV